MERRLLSVVEPLSDHDGRTTNNKLPVRTKRTVAGLVALDLIDRLVVSKS